MTKELSDFEKGQVFEIAQSILNRLSNGNLTRVPLLNLDELPSASGVYFVTTRCGNVLYVGKARDFRIRCNLSTHHKLPLMLNQEAVYLHIAKTHKDVAWHIEQRLIDELKPAFNGPISRWWLGSSVKPETQLQIKGKHDLERYGTVDITDGKILIHLKSQSALLDLISKAENFYKIAEWAKNNQQEYISLTHKGRKKPIKIFASSAT